MLPRMTQDHASPAPATALDAEIPFTPVPLRARRDGWTEARQRDFIAALARIGSVSTAARHVGKTRRSAYKLRERPGAEGFAAAWDEAADRGRFNLQDHVIDRALNGAYVPRFYRGRQTGMAFRHYDQIAVAVLGGGVVGIAEQLRKAEERGGRNAYFDIERAWRFHYDRMMAAEEALVLARAKLARLVELGVIGADWLDPPRDTMKHMPPPAVEDLPLPEDEDDDARRFRIRYL